VKIFLLTSLLQTLTQPQPFALIETDVVISQQFNQLLILLRITAKQVDQLWHLLISFLLNFDSEVTLANQLIHPACPTETKKPVYLCGQPCFKLWLLTQKTSFFMLFAANHSLKPVGRGDKHAVKGNSWENTIRTLIFLNIFFEVSELWLCWLVNFSEKVAVPKYKQSITFQGQGYTSTAIVWNDTAKSSNGTFYSASVQVFSNYFVAKNISFMVRHGSTTLNHIVSWEEAVTFSFSTLECCTNSKPWWYWSPAVAIRISGDQAVFLGCGFFGAQDTLHDDRGRHHFKDRLLYPRFYWFHLWQCKVTVWGEHISIWSKTDHSISFLILLA
jgi:hypothetical protein